MLIRSSSDIAPSEITSHTQFEDRRRFIARAGFGFAAGAALWHGMGGQAHAAAKLATLPSALSTTEALTEH